MSIPTQGPAPDFTLPDEEGQLHSLADYLGKPVVLYFYPRDDTPGCTKEACGFRDDYSAYEEAGVTILGVSPDTSSSHANFKAKYELPFTLLSDPNHEVLEVYGAWGLKKSFGREYMGVLRTTFLIDENGEIIKVFEKVKPAQHSAEILAAL
jgi:peroxiredoxin Q/BCP